MPNVLIYLAELINQFGWAWWVEIKTSSPTCIYFFGPFLSHQEAQSASAGYVEDLESEQPRDIAATIRRCQPSQLTVCW